MFIKIYVEFENATDKFTAINTASAIIDLIEGRKDQEFVIAELKAISQHLSTHADYLSNTKH